LTNLLRFRGKAPLEQAEGPEPEPEPKERTVEVLKMTAGLA